MSLLWATLSRASDDIIAFVFLFVIVFFGFVLMGHVLFGTDIYDFRTVFDALTSCFQMLLGNVDYDSMRNVNRVLAPIYFLLFVFLVFLTLVNMFIAILNDAYSDLHPDTIDLPPLATTFKKAIMRYWTKIKNPKDAMKSDLLPSESKLLKTLERANTSSETGQLKLSELKRLTDLGEHEEKHLKALDQKLKQKQKSTRVRSSSTEKNMEKK